MSQPLCMWGETPHTPLACARPPALFAESLGGLCTKDAPASLAERLPSGGGMPKDALPSRVARWGGWGFCPSKGTLSSKANLIFLSLCPRYERIGGR